MQAQGKTSKLRTRNFIYYVLLLRPDGGDGRVQLTGGDPLPSQRYPGGPQPVTLEDQDEDTLLNLNHITHFLYIIAPIS